MKTIAAPPDFDQQKVNAEHEGLEANETNPPGRSRTVGFFA